MRTLKRLAQVSALGALVIAVGAGAVWAVRRARAAPTLVEEQGFGMVGIRHGQTLRLNVVNLNPPPEPDRQYPPDPCRATAEVFDNTSGRTSFFIWFTTPPDPNRGQ